MNIQEKAETATFTYQGTHLLLLPEKAIYWAEEKVLLVTDLHFGKSGHFRKNGLALPQGVMETDLARLDTICKTCNPERLVFLGDLFHSRLNQEWNQFVHWRKNFCAAAVELVRGNHDIIPNEEYYKADIAVYPHTKEEGPFLLSHHPAEEAVDGKYVLAGHLHPGVSLVSRGRQKLSLPCFYFGGHGGILPAFGSFTGLCLLNPRPADHIYVIAEGQVIGMKRPG